MTQGHKYTVCHFCDQFIKQNLCLVNIWSQSKVLDKCDWMMVLDKNHGITKVIRIDPKGDMNVCAKYFMSHEGEHRFKSDQNP